MITDFYTTTFTVRRATWDTDAGGNDFSEEAEVSTFCGHIQQAQADLVQNLGMSFTKAYTIWCAVDSDVSEGDTLASESDTYFVRAIQKNNLGGNQHLQLVVEKGTPSS